MSGDGEPEAKKMRLEAPPGDTAPSGVTAAAAAGAPGDAAAVEDLGVEGEGALDAATRAVLDQVEGVQQELNKVRVTCVCDSFGT